MFRRCRRPMGHSSGALWVGCLRASCSLSMGMAVTPFDLTSSPSTTCARAERAVVAPWDSESNLDLVGC